MAEAKTIQRRDAQTPEVAGNVWPFRRKGSEQENTRIAFPIDICETEEAFLLVGEMPGVSKDGVQIRIDENQLSITGRFQTSLDREEDVIFHEIPGADYHRSFTLSDAISREKISAELKDGVLTVQLAKAESVKPREIQITA